MLKKLAMGAVQDIESCERRIDKIKGARPQMTWKLYGVVARL